MEIRLISNLFAALDYPWHCLNAPLTKQFRFVSCPYIELKRKEKKTESDKGREGEQEQDKCKIPNITSGKCVGRGGGVVVLVKK